MQQNIRFFIYSEELDAADDNDPIEEVSERQFIAYQGVIQYERHTMRENGVSQVCLTKYPEWMMKL